jgi:hypothetical protein
MQENKIETFIRIHGITATIREVPSQKPELYYPHLNRCWEANIHHNQRIETFYVYTGLGWNSYSLEQVIRYLKDTNDPYFDTFEAWDKDSGNYYSHELTEEGARLFWKEHSENYYKLVSLLGYDLYESLVNIA